MASDVHLTRRGRLNIAESGNESGERRPVVSRLPADFERRRDRGSPPGDDAKERLRKLVLPDELGADAAVGAWVAIGWPVADVDRAACPWALRRPSAVRLI